MLFFFESKSYLHLISPILFFFIVLVNYFGRLDSSASVMNPIKSGNHGMRVRD